MIKNTRFLSLFITLLSLPWLGFADQGPDDAQDYMWTNSAGSPSVDYDWIDISGGTDLFGTTFDDSVSGPITLPFTFSFYNTNRSQVWISSNGWLTFVTPGDSTYPANYSIPAGGGPDHVIAPYWDDLSSTTGHNSGVYYATVGTAPNRKFIVQWYILEGSPIANVLQFQVQLFEHSNQIKFLYQAVDAVYSGGAAATIGIKATSSLGNQYSFNTAASVESAFAILFHNSTLTGVSAAISPASVQIGQFVTFNYRVTGFTPTLNRLGKLDRIVITNPFTTTPTVTAVKINNSQAFIQNTTGKPADPGFANWSYNSGPRQLTIETADFDVIDSVRISFLLSVPQVSTGLYNFAGSFDAQLDLSAAVPAIPGPAVTVTAGALSYIRIRSAAGGGGIEVGNRTITSDSTITVYAAGYDAGGNFIGDQAANWSVTGTLDGPTTSNQTSYTFSPVLAPRTGTITATVGSFSDATGTITVNTGALNSLTIRSAPNNGGFIVGTLGLTTDDSFTFYAASYDADGNYRGEQSVNWTSTLGISGSGTSITYSPTQPASGILTATSGSVSDVTGLITVSGGALNSLVIRDAPNQGGSIVGNRTITADQTLTLYAAGYDAENNYLGDQTVDWTVTGTLDGSNTIGQPSYTFSPVLAPRSGSISASSGGVSDITGTITVNPGNLSTLTIRSAPNNGGVAVGIVNLTTDDSFTFYAAGYDAESNYRGDEIVTWTSTLGIGGSGTSITYTPTQPDTGIVTATSGLISDNTGEIRVISGELNYIVVRDAPNQGGSIVGNRTITADQTLNLYAAGYDINNNYLGDQLVDWTVTGTLDGPNTSNQPSYAFSPVLAPATGSIIASSGGISDATGTITVNTGQLNTLTIRSAPNNGGFVVGIVNLTTDDSFTFYAAGFDADGNYRGDENVSWTSTLGISGSGTSITYTPSVPDTGIVTATSGLVSDVTGQIRVTGGSLNYIVIRDAPNRGGSVVADRAITADQTLTLYAAGYDAENNYLGDQTVNWTVTGSLDGPDLNNLPSYTFSPALAPASGSIIASAGTINDATGTISVNPGILNTLAIRSAPANGGFIVGIVNLTTDDSFTFYAAGYDADGNYRGDESVTWTSTLGIGGTGTSLTYTPVAPDTGIVTATSGIISDTTGQIRVSGGTLNYIVVRDAPNGGGSIVGNRTITADNILTLYAAGYDVNNNFLGDQVVNWTVTGTLDGPSLPGQNSYTFAPVLAPRSGSIIASSGGISDATGTITVNPGILNTLTIRSAAGNSGFVVDILNLTTDDSFTFWAAGYDADGNYRGDESVNWTSTLGISGTGTSITYTPSLPDTGIVTATSGLISDVTGQIRVTSGLLEYLIIRDGPNGTGTAVAARTLTTDDSLRLYAAGYDINNNFIGDQIVNWTVTGSLDGNDLTGASTYTFSPALAGVSGSIIASTGGINDATGTITVNVGALHHVQINETGLSDSEEFLGATLTTDQSITLYAAGYDADNNWRSLVPATWSRIGNLDPVSGTGTSYTFDPVTAPRSGAIIAVYTTLRDTTGTIDVITGLLDHLAIRSAAGGLGTEVTNVNITADDTLRLWAAGYDASNNYLGDFSVDWLTTGTLDVISATTIQFNFAPVRAPASGSIIARSGATISDVTGTISVAVGAQHHIRINDAPGAGGVAVGAETLNAGQSLNLYASSYDADNNYRSAVSPVWSSTGTLDSVAAAGSTFTFTPVTAPTSGTIVATAGTLVDATGIITVEQGGLAYIRLRTAANGGGVIIGDTLITADQTLTLFAAGYDANNNYLSDLSVSWTRTGTLDQVIATGTSYTFSPTTAPTSGTIVGTSGVLFDNTGTITVAVGALASIRINNAAGAGGAAVQDVSLTADQSVTLYAAGYDADNNYRSPVSATWSRVGNLDPVSFTGSSFTFSPATAPTSGTIIAVSSGFSDNTGTISVTPGALARIQINNAAGASGVAVGNVTLTVGQSLALYAAGYDAENNYRELVSSVWSSTGSLDNVSTTATNITFVPTTAATNGTIIITSGGFNDATGTITVNQGSLAYLRIRTAPNGGGSVVTTVNLTADQSITLYAASYDLGDNYLGPVAATWSSSGSLDPVSATGTSYVFDPVTAPASGTISIAFAGRNTSTELITVSPGAAAALTDWAGLGGNRTTVAGSTQLIRVRVVDQHGNPVSGEIVQFEPALRMSDATDVSDADGMAQTTYSTPRTEGQSIVQASITGLSTYLFTVYGIRYVSNSLDPKVIMRGNPVAFQVNVSNTGNVPVPLNASQSNLSFDDGAGHSFTAPLLSAYTIPANTPSYALTFTSTTINSQFIGGQYTPEIQLTGRDNFASMNGILFTDPGELTIGDSAITIGVAQIFGPSGPNQALQGDVGVTATVSVLNAGIPLDIDPFPQTTILFRRHSDNSLQPVLNLQRIDDETILPTNTPVELQYSFNIPSNYTLGQIDVYVILSLDGGNLVVIPVEPSGSFEVQSAGNAAYVANSLDPDIVVPRQQVSFRLSFANSGSANIVLNPTQTTLNVLGTSIPASSLISQFTLLGNSTTAITFNQVTIPSTIAPDAYDLRIRLYGTLVNGATFDQTYTLSEVLTVNRAARMIFADIDITEDVVRQGQPDVTVDYVIRNTGQSAGRVTGITHRFKIGSSFIPASDWISTDLAPGLPQTINPGAQLQLRATYSLSNNASLGLVQPAPVVSYQDTRTLTLTDTSQTILSNDLVQVIRPASLRIDSLTMVRNTLAPNAPVVNQNQNFQMRILLHNTGDDLISTVVVDVLRGSSQTPFRQETTQNIAAGQTRAILFTSSEPDAGDIVYKVRINSAVDAVGNNALIDQPLDITETIIVEIPSNLRFASVFRQAGVETDSLTVSVDQLITVRTSIENSGESQFVPGNDGRLVLRLPGTYLEWLEPDEADSIRSFVRTDTYVEWVVRARQITPQSVFQSIGIDLLQAPLDANSSNPVPYSFENDQLAIRVREKGAITRNSLSIIDPEGATDGVISTGQTFVLQSQIDYNFSIADTGRTAILNLPEGFEVSGGAVTDVPDSLNTVVKEWTVTAPTGAVDLQILSVMATAYDRYSGLPVEVTSASLEIDVFEKARLQLSLQVEKIAGDFTDTLSVGQRFKLRAALTNAGKAQTTGTARIYLQDINIHPALTRLDTLGSNSDTLAVDVNSSAFWYLQVDRVAQAKIDSLFSALIDIRDKLSRSVYSAETYNTIYSGTAAQLFGIVHSVLTSQSDVRVGFATVPQDENTNARAFVENEIVVKSLFLQERAFIGDLETTIASDTVSTGMTFSYTVSSSPSSNLTDAEATITVPQGFITSPVSKTIALDADNSATWNITVPPTAFYTGDDQAFIESMIIGRDANSNETLLSLPVIDTLVVQARPRLIMKYEVIEPEAAKSQGVLSLGQPITIDVWADTLSPAGNIRSADISGAGSIAIDQAIFSAGNFQRIEGENYVKTFTRLEQKLRFRLRAADQEETVSINFRYQNLPGDKNSDTQLAEVDLDSGSVSIPIRVRAKEVTVKLLNSVFNQTSYTRGASKNTVLAFSVSNIGYEDLLELDGLDIKWRAAQNDTTSMTKTAIFNMLDSVRVVNYAFFMAEQGDPSIPGPKIYAEYGIVNEDSVNNPLFIPFNEDIRLQADTSEIFIVQANFKSIATSRKFRAQLAYFYAYEPGSTVPVSIVDSAGVSIDDNDAFSSPDFSVLSNDPKESFNNYPNPFGQPPNEITKIRFFITENNSDVRVRIFTLTGELVKAQWGKNLSNLARGIYDGYLTWDGRNDRSERVLNGVYICAIEIKGPSSTQRFTIKMAYIK